MIDRKEWNPALYRLRQTTVEAQRLRVATLVNHECGLPGDWVVNNDGQKAIMTDVEFRNYCVPTPVDPAPCDQSCPVYNSENMPCQWGDDRYNCTKADLDITV